MSYRTKVTKEIEKKIVQFYLDGFSSTEIKNKILEKYRVSLTSETIRKWIRRNGVSIRGNRAAVILFYRNKQPIKKVLAEYSAGRPIREISRNTGLGRLTVKKILLENGFKVRNSRNAQLIMGFYEEKEKFSLGLSTKAYLFGLVMGDLTPVQKTNFTLQLITHTTHLEFVKLLHDVFSPYGPTSDGLRKQGDVRFSAYLDLESFDFLLSAKDEVLVPWISDINFFHFLGGFVDSDGSIYVKKAGKYFQFVIRFFGQGLEILKEIKKRLERIGYRANLSMTHAKGTVSWCKGVKFVYNKDYYTLEISQKQAVIDLIGKIPFRHPEKKLRAQQILKIYNSKVFLWNDISADVIALRTKLRKSVLPFQPRL